MEMGKLLEYLLADRGKKTLLEAEQEGFVRLFRGHLCAPSPEILVSNGGGEMHRHSPGAG